jgi:hypothetical protein
VFHAGRTLPSRAEEPDEGTDRNYNAPGKVDSVWTGALLNEGTQGLRGICFGVIAD